MTAWIMQGGLQGAGIDSRYLEEEDKTKTVLIEDKRYDDQSGRAAG